MPIINTQFVLQERTGVPSPKLTIVPILKGFEPANLFAVVTSMIPIIMSVIPIDKTINDIFEAFMSTTYTKKIKKEKI